MKLKKILFFLLSITTFSAFSLDAAGLINSKQQAAAVFYVAGSVGLSIVALYAGIALAKAALT